MGRLEAAWPYPYHTLPVLDLLYCEAPTQSSTAVGAELEERWKHDVPVGGVRGFSEACHAPMSAYLIPFTCGE